MVSFVQFLRVMVLNLYTSSKTNPIIVTYVRRIKTSIQIRQRSNVFFFPPNTTNGIICEENRYKRIPHRRTIYFYYFCIYETDNNITIRIV